MGPSTVWKRWRPVHAKRVVSFVARFPCTRNFFFVSRLVRVRPSSSRLEYGAADHWGPSFETKIEMAKQNCLQIEKTPKSSVSSTQIAFLFTMPGFDAAAVLKRWCLVYAKRHFSMEFAVSPTRNHHLWNAILAQPAVARPRLGLDKLPAATRTKVRDMPLLVPRPELAPPRPATFQAQFGFASVGHG